MPSDSPPHPVRPADGAFWGGKATTSAVRDGTLVFALVLGGFVAYALLAPTTYRATAVVGVAPIPGAAPVALPKADEASQKLRLAALDPAFVRRLASEEHPAPPETTAQIAARIEKSLMVESQDKKSFAFAVTAPDAARAQHLANELAQRAARHAVALFDPEPEPEADPAERAKAELLDFLVDHPHIASEPTVAPLPDMLMLALRAERTRIEAKLAEPRASASDNPYGDPKPLEDPSVLKRRLKEIDAALEARPKPVPKRGPARPAVKEPSAAERAEWQRLLRAVSEKRVEPRPPRAQRLKATLARAGLPSSPMEPDRPRLMLLGLVLACIAGVLAGGWRGVMEGRARRRDGAPTAPPIPLPQTTLRIPRSELPKQIAPRSDPPLSPVPLASPDPAPALPPIPRPPLVPAPITPVPPAPTHARLSPIPAPPLVPVPITPVPAAPAPEPKHAVVTDEGPPPDTRPGPPAALAPSNPTPEDASDKARDDGPSRRAAHKTNKRTTKIYGTPPAPEPTQQAKAFRTTQVFGTAPIATNRSSPVQAEAVPPAHRNSIAPAPMPPLSRSSAPPPGAPGTRSGPPLSQTGYSYVQTPVPAAYSIPQTPMPRHPPSPPPTRPFGSVPPLTPRPTDGFKPSPGELASAVPAPAPRAPRSPVRTHGVVSTWQPDTVLSAARRRALAREILGFALERCLVLAVTGVRGAASEKSIAAAEIAMALAEAGHPRVLLVESDFHFPQVQKWLKLDVPLSAGFSQQLRARIQASSEARWHVVEVKPTLHVLAEGVLRSPGLLLSNQFELALRELRDEYDVIVIDAPVAPEAAEAQALSDVTDGAVIVGPAKQESAVAEVRQYFSGKSLLRIVES
jgi:Mrp family chromosome partitioning ATPase